MEKIVTMPKMSKIDLNKMCFKIILSMKGDIYRARTETLSKIPNIKNNRPEATSKNSYNDAVQKLIPKIENSLEGTDQKLGEIYQEENGSLIFYVQKIIYSEPQPTFSFNNMSMDTSSMSNIFNLFLAFISNNKNLLQENNIDISFMESLILNQQNNTSTNLKQYTNKTFWELVVEWLRYIHSKTELDPDDEDYLSTTTLESYSRNLWAYIFPYLQKNPQHNNILTFSSEVVDIIFKEIKCLDTKRVLLISLKSIFDFAMENNYIKYNPLLNKKVKKGNKNKKVKDDYQFIEEDRRAIWLNYMIKEFHSEDTYYNDASIAFLCTLLQGDRPEETCGTKWKDFDFENNTYHIQNAYKKIGVYDKVTMKRIGWTTGDGPLKTPESDRVLTLDLLLKELLLEHRDRQKEEYKKLGKKWTEEEYVFRNQYGKPFTPDILSRNFLKFIRRHEDLEHMVIYGLRHSFATHCRNNGMEPEVLAKIMGHTTYETTQKYYIHVSKKQKKEELEKVQKQDLHTYLGKENKELVHLQNKVSNLQELQQDDIINYVQLDDKTLTTLKAILTKIIQKERVAA